MNFRRVGGLAGIALAIMFWMSCGQVYRPVVIPIAVTPPNSQNYHAVFALSNNVQANPGSAFEIDVSGDTNIGQTNVGVVPTHAATLPNNSRVFVASAGTLFAGQSDVVTSFTPAFPNIVATGLGSITTFTYPNVGPLGSNGTPLWTCSYLPDFVATTQPNAVYVSNYGVEGDPACAPNPTLPNGNSTDSVFLLNPANNTVANTAYLAPGSHPVALAETPNAQNLYVVNQGSNTVTDLSPLDLSTLGTINVGANPVWAVARVDNQRVYVLSQGDGSLYTIRTDTNAIVSAQSVGGAGANFVLYDKNLNRLYVTNPASGGLYVFSATTDPPTPLGSASGLVTIPPPPPCSVVTCSSVVPVSVTALADGSRFYVASYVTVSGACPDGNVGVQGCLIPQLTVFNAASLTVKPVFPACSVGWQVACQQPPVQVPQQPSLSLFTAPQFVATQYAVPAVSSCAPTATYAPGTTRFRMFATASTDGSHVYVSMCDGGAIADVQTNSSSISTGGTNAPDTLVTDLPSPFGACVGSGCSTVATITSFQIASNIVTFYGTNNFTPGTKVQISGLTSTAGAPLNGQTLAVVATGTTPSPYFQCALTAATQNVPQTTDSGTAVPLLPPQSPVFLLTGQ